MSPLYPPCILPAPPLYLCTSPASPTQVTLRLYGARAPRALGRGTATATHRIAEFVVGAAGADGRPQWLCNTSPLAWPDALHQPGLQALGPTPDPDPNLNPNPNPNPNPNSNPDPNPNPHPNSEPVLILTLTLGVVAPSHGVGARRRPVAHAPPGRGRAAAGLAVRLPHRSGRAAALGAARRGAGARGRGGGLALPAALRPGQRP